MKSITINSLIVALALGNTSFVFAKQPPGLAKPPVPAAPAALPELPDVQESWSFNPQTAIRWPTKKFRSRKLLAKLIR